MEGLGDLAQYSWLAWGAMFYALAQVIDKWNSSRQSASSHDKWINAARLLESLEKDLQAVPAAFRDPGEVKQKEEAIKSARSQVKKYADDQATSKWLTAGAFVLRRCGDACGVIGVLQATWSLFEPVRIFAQSKLRPGTQTLRSNQLAFKSPEFRGFDKDVAAIVH